MNFGIWQIVYICLMVFSVGATMAKHGEPKEGNHNVIVTLIAAAIEIAIVAAGGFFSK